MAACDLHKVKPEIDMEIWKSIKGFSGYEVSNLARIRTTKMLTPVKQIKMTIGYMMCYLYPDNGGCKKQNYVHRLVADAFIENELNKPQVNHIDGIKDNNFASNLQWVTKSENAIHAVKTGLTIVPNLKGEESPTSKLKNDDIIDILKMGLICKIPAVKICKLYDVHSSLINLILKGKIWNDQFEAFKKVFLL